MVNIDMLTLIQFIEEIARKDLTIPPADVERMRERFGERFSRWVTFRKMAPCSCLSIAFLKWPIRVEANRKMV